MKVLALDIATATGWAIGSPAGVERVGTFRAPDSFHPQDLGKRWAAFREWCGAMIDLEKPAVVAFEAPLVQGGGQGKTNHLTVRVLFGLATLAETTAYERGVDCCEANVMSVRKLFCGNGHASKDDVVARCGELGIGVADHNQADAVALLSHTLHDIGHPPTWDSGL